MNLKLYTRTAIALALGCASLFGQTITSSLIGTVVDPADAAVANAPVTLTNTQTNATRSASTDSSGTYRFLSLDPGTYTVTVKAPGFKAMTQTGVVVSASETHNGGKMVLQLGNVSESISVTAELAAVQLQSSEKAQTVDANALESLTLKGRDLFGYMKLVPGVIDTSTTRDVTGPGAIGGITINGNTSAKNFTVDGITDMDTGSNGTLHYEPNLDSIQELKVLTSNYQAEFGRNSGGTITVVTKSGTQDFHGTAAWNHRHEEFNANSWSNNHTLKNINGLNVATPRVPYRYNVETYSIGGPAYIPKFANKSKRHLFFFWSQEYTGQYVAGTSQTLFMPTAADRIGDFSADRGNSNGNPVALKLLDPANNNQQFAGNKIPQSRINPVGQKLLNFFPLPNYNPTIPTQLYVDNYFEQGSASHPRRNDVLRIDTQITSKVSAYFRWINDHDDMSVIFSGVQFSGNPAGRESGLPAMANIDHPNPGHGYSWSSTQTLSPTLVNEVTVANSWNTWAYYSLDNYADSLRSLEPGLPVLFPTPGAADNGPMSKTNGYLPLLPTFQFGGGTYPGAASYTRNGTSAGAEENFNPIWTYQDNISKVVGNHAFKAGIYLEHNLKLQPSQRNYNGQFSFGASSSNPFLNTNSGYANALLGDVNNYHQYNITTTFNVKYWNAEWYLQDNWKVNRRLTLDLGLRFYHQTPQIDLNNTFVNFNTAKYNKSVIPRIYQPFCASGAASCSGADRVARDPGTGALVSGGFIGDYVPKSGDPGTGLETLGVNGVKSEAYSQAWVALGPRLGFAYDLMGNGKTALRGGWGIFYNRLDGNQVYGMSGQAPAAYEQNVSSVTLDDIAAQNTGAPPSFNSLAVSPLAPTGWAIGKVPFDAVQNASLDIQRNIGSSMVVDVGYTLNYSYNQVLNYNINYIPLGSGWPFNPAALDPTTSGKTSNSISQWQGGILQRSLYPSYNSITTRNFLGHNNYNALTVNVNRRYSHGLQWGAVYTFSRGMGTTAFTPVVPNNEAWNYGRLGSDRRHNLQVNYTYDIPGVAKHFDIRYLGAITDHWSLSGITSFQSGSPYDPGCGYTSGTASVTGGFTGTPDLGQRCNVIGDPLSNIGTNGNGQVYFNPAAYAMPALPTGPNNSIVGPPAIGNMGGGAGNLTRPHVTNFDVTLTKNVPLGSEKRVLRFQAQAYNVFNHTEITGIGTGIQFSPTTNQVTNPQVLGYINGATGARVLAFSARLQF
ncbi:MAG TPA: carboxypeptidase regulatory-like domain-containing protein [Bryobacteraceae bacterium]|nr:carboxypeptidase regulatory-like domain-containing protein [Bryobacteraceae bacterium]